MYQQQAPAVDQQHPTTTTHHRAIAASSTTNVSSGGGAQASSATVGARPPQMRLNEFRLVVILARRCCTRVLITAACGRFVLHDFFGRLVPLKKGNTQPTVTTHDCVAQAPGIQCRCATG